MLILKNASFMEESAKREMELNIEKLKIEIDVAKAQLEDLRKKSDGRIENGSSRNGNETRRFGKKVVRNGVIENSIQTSKYGRKERNGKKP